VVEEGRDVVGGDVVGGNIGVVEEGGTIEPDRQSNKLANRC
jgi:hypothetical protein